MSASAPELVGNWDVRGLERALANLVSNAIKYSPDAGEIDVHAWRETALSERWAVVSVADQGAGIPPGEMSRIFEHYHRGSNRAGYIRGTGVGVAAAKQNVEQHGGSIVVESNEGRGSEFQIKVPIAAT